MKNKTFLVIVVLVFLLGVPAAILLIKRPAIFHLGATTTSQPENIRTVQITENSAKITWTTAKANQGLVSYGLTANNLTLVHPENTPALNHQITLTRLLPGRQYFFVIKIDGESFSDNNDQPYEFTTPAKEASSTPAPIVLTEENLLKVLGTNNTTYDLNRDGIVNTLDLYLLREQGK